MTTVFPKYFTGSDTNFMLLISLTVALSILIRSPVVLAIFNFTTDIFPDYSTAYIDT